MCFKPGSDWDKRYVRGIVQSKDWQQQSSSNIEFVPVRILEYTAYGKELYPAQTVHGGFNAEDLIKLDELKQEQIKQEQDQIIEI